MKVVLLLTLVALTTSLPHHHEIDHTEGEHTHSPHDHHVHDMTEGKDTHEHHTHEHQHEEDDELNETHGDDQDETHEHNHHHHGSYHHNHGKWQRYREEWKSFKKQMKTMSEDMKALKETVAEIKDEVQENEPKVSLEDAKEELNLDSDKGYMKIWYKSKSQVKLVTGDGEVSDVSLPTSSAIIKVHTPKDDTFQSWHRIKADTAIYWHQGPAMKLHIVHADGSHEVSILGNALKPEDEDEVELPTSYFGYIPGDAFFALEYLDKTPESYTVVSYSCAPGYTKDRHTKFPLEETEDGQVSFVPTQDVLDNLKK